MCFPRAMMSRSPDLSVKTLLGVALALAIGVLLLLPMSLRAWASHQAMANACDSMGAPDDRLFRAMATLDVVARFPGFQATGSLATDAATSCLAVFHEACDVPRDNAIARAQGTSESWESQLDHVAVQRVCETWQPWRTWMTSQNLDASAACPICALPLEDTP